MGLCVALRDTLLTDTQNLFRYSVTKLKSYVIQRKNTVYKIFVQLKITCTVSHRDVGAKRRKKIFSLLLHWKLHFSSRFWQISIIYHFKYKKVYTVINYKKKNRFRAVTPKSAREILVARTGCATWSREHAIRSLHFLSPCVAYTHSRTWFALPRYARKNAPSALPERRTDARSPGGKLAAGRRGERRGQAGGKLTQDLTPIWTGESDIPYVKDRARLNKSG